MTDPKIFVVLPPQSMDAVAAVRSAGGIPVIDLEAGDCTEIPKGTWVRLPAGKTVEGAAGAIHIGEAKPRWNPHCSNPTEANPNQRVSKESCLETQVVEEGHRATPLRTDGHRQSGGAVAELGGSLNRRRLCATKTFKVFF